jgi:pimeloyl-ACP methyl ester carboxylesterase
VRDNALTLLGQTGEQRNPYSRADAESIRVPTLFVGGADRPGPLTATLRALAASIPNARVATIPETTDHLMFVQEPVRFCAIVNDFLLDQGRTSVE